MKQPFILQLPSQYHHLCFFFFFKPGPATLTQQKGHLHQLNHPKTETKRSQCDHKGMVYSRFMKGHCIRRRGGGDTYVHLRGPCALLLRELGGTEFFFFFFLLCCIGPCRHSGHRVNTVKHCTMPLGTVRSRHGPRMELWGW